ncbi:PDR/VanB family oxidoreductase [Nocardia arthritidis]|uniref:PDR/VanB family oxidoreductase n=1 Tax=Nocardia arthritidis TaxID=228602 RepID=UPI0007A54951|nr:PDR/VanB family oxidoreductase [Nocardia arthritidis]
MDVIVTRKFRAAADVVVIEFADPTGATLPPWTPGAHIEIEPAPGLRRSYSLIDGDERLWQIAVLHDHNSRGGSRYIHQQLTPGTVVSARGPRNDFPLYNADRYLFVAGGIGVTPILPMLRHVHRRRADWRLLYGGRRRASMAFLDELDQYGDRVRIHPQDEKGLLPLDRALSDLPAGTLVYCCGPEPLLDAVGRHGQQWSPGTLHTERFAAATTGNTAFYIHLARSNLTLHVPPDRSILDVIEQAGIGVLSSCRSGTCGTCETTVLDGRVNHRDTVLTDDERRDGATMMICCSRSQSPVLTLEL